MVPARPAQSIDLSRRGLRRASSALTWSSRRALAQCCGRAGAAVLSTAVRRHAPRPRPALRWRAPDAPPCAAGAASARRGGAWQRPARARAGDAAPSPRSLRLARPRHRHVRHGQHRTAEPDRLHERQRSPACPGAAGAGTAAARMHGKCSFDGSRRILPGQRPGTALNAWRRQHRLPAQEPDPNRCTAARAIAVAVLCCGT
jgi:hypothetical protein